MGELHASLGRLHAKLAVVDNRFLFIGSMNMDGRSARWNTEVGLVIDSPELAGEVASLLKRERLPSSYKLRMASDDQRIEWVAGQDKNEVVHCRRAATPPGASSCDCRWCRCSSRKTCCEPDSGARWPVQPSLDQIGPISSGRISMRPET